MGNQHGNNGAGHFGLSREAKHEVRYASIATEIHMERLRGRPDESKKLRRTPLTEYNEDTVAEYFRVHDRVMRFIKHSINVHIQSIERIDNPVLDRRLYKVYKELHKKDCVPQLLIHGTQNEFVERIIKNGFKLGTGGMYGAGIYFATDSTKSAQYCGGSGVKSLLLCDVLLGETMVLDAPRSDLNLRSVRAEGYDSTFAKRNTKGTGGVLNDEYIVYRSEQATPRYLVKFTTT